MSNFQVQNYSFFKNKKFKYIIHIADIHIMNDISRHNEFKNVFKTLLNQIKTNKKYNKNNTLLFIGGDLLNDPKKYLADAENMTKELLTNLSKLVTTILIPGNHDNNLRNNTKIQVDNLTAITNELESLNKNLFYLRNSGIYTFGNISFSHISVFDLDKIPSDNEGYKQRQELLISSNDPRFPPNTKKIQLIHTTFDNVQLPNGYALKGCGYQLKDFCGYDFVLAGDNHKVNYVINKNNSPECTNFPKSLENKIAFPGSLLQLNFGEEDIHGYLIWNLDTGKPQFYPVNNEYGFRTLVFQENKKVDIENIQWPKYTRLRCIIIDNYAYEKEYSEIFDALNKKTKIIKIWPPVYKYTKNFNQEKEKINENFSKIQNDDQIFLEYAKEKINKNDLKNVLDLFKKFNTQETNDKTIKKWKPITIEIKGILSYKNYVKINFEKFNGIYGILGENSTGKSTILKSILYAIYGNIPGFTKKDIPNKELRSANSKNFFSKFTFRIEGNDKIYCIHRTIKTLNFYENNENISEQTQPATQKLIDSIFGKQDNLLSTCISSQRNYSKILDSTPAKRIEVFYSLLNLYKFSNIVKKIRKRNTFIKGLLTNINQDIISIKKRIKELNEDDLKYNIKQIEKNILNNTKNIEKIINSIMIFNIEYKNFDISKQQILQKKLDNFYTEIKKLKSNIKYIPNNYDFDKDNKINYFQNKIDKHKKILDELYKNKDSIEILPGKYFDDVLDIDPLKTEKYNLNQKITTLQKKVKNSENFIDRQKKILNNLDIKNTNISEITKKYQELQIIKKDLIILNQNKNKCENEIKFSKKELNNYIEFHFSSENTRNRK